MRVIFDGIAIILMRKIETFTFFFILIDGGCDHKKRAYWLRLQSSKQFLQ